MFHHINEEMRTVHGRFSKPGLLYTLQMPEAYFTSSVSTFSEHQGEIRMTGWKLLNPGRKYRGKALVVVDSCHYRKTSDLTIEEAIDESKKKLIQAQKTLLKVDAPMSVLGEMNEALMQAARQHAYELAHNSELYDHSGESVSIISDKDISDGTRLYDVLVTLDSSGNRILTKCSAHRDTPANSKNSLADMVQGLLLNPSLQIS